MASRREQRSLMEILRENPDGISAEQLFAKANYSDSEVDRFYSHLSTMRDDIEELKPAGAKALQWPHESQVILRLKGG